MRKAQVTRNTQETQITVAINLDGQGKAQLDSGVPFLDHMLDQIARHGMIDLNVTAQGDLHIDAHHTVEDIGIALGQALNRAIGDKKEYCVMAMHMCLWMKRCQEWSLIYQADPVCSSTRYSRARLSALSMSI